MLPEDYNVILMITDMPRITLVPDFDWDPEEQCYSQNSSSYIRYFTLSSFGTLQKNVNRIVVDSDSLDVEVITRERVYSVRIKLIISIIFWFMNPDTNRWHLQSWSFNLYLIFAAPQNHRIVEVGRLLWRSFSGTLLPKQSELEQIVPVVFLISPRTETASVSGQPLPVFDVLPVKLFIHIDEVLPSLLFSRLRSSDLLSHSSDGRCSKLLIIFTDFPWTGMSMTMSFLHWGTQNWTHCWSHHCWIERKDHLPPLACDTALPNAAHDAVGFL